jgi:hypothetical protein
LRCCCLRRSIGCDGIAYRAASARRWCFRVLVSALGASANAVWDPARDWLDTAPSTMRMLERKLQPLTRFIAKVESVSDQAGQIAAPAAPANAEGAPVPVVEHRNLVLSTQHWAISIVTTLMITYFLLAMGPALLARWSTDPHTGPSAAETGRRIARGLGGISVRHMTIRSSASRPRSRCTRSACRIRSSGARWRSR